MNEAMRVFPSITSNRAATMHEAIERVNCLPVIEVKPGRPHLAGPREWDDCDDCTELRALAEDVNREAQMSTEEQIEAFWANVPRAFHPRGTRE